MARSSATMIQKSPLLASLLSLIIPGLGQLYTREVTKALCIIGACLLIGGGMWWFSGLNRLTLGLALMIVWLSSVLDAYKTAQTFGQPQDWYFRRAYVVTMLLLVGPLAFPLLWRSPYFSRIAKWGWSGLVTTVAALFLATPYLLHWLVQRIPELQAVLQQSGIQP